MRGSVDRNGGSGTGKRRVDPGMGLACRGWLDGVINGERENCAKMTMSTVTQGGFDAGGVGFEGVPKGF